MSSKEVFLFDENAAIKKLDSKTKLSDNEKKTSSDLKTDDLKKDDTPKNEDGSDNLKKEVDKDILSEIDDPFFFA